MKRSASIAAAFVALTASAATSGDAVGGVTSHGGLKAGQAELLPYPVNHTGCWMDSANWDGQDLYFAIAGYDYNELVSKARFRKSKACKLPAGHHGKAFDIYRARLGDDGWKLFPQSGINTREHEAGVSVSGDVMAYVDYDGGGGNWEILLADSNGPDSWQKRGSFPWNSSCKEDNPDIYRDGRAVVFESGRADAQGKKCLKPVGEVVRLWGSEIDGEGNWSQPQLLEVPSQGSTKVSQPWVDEDNGWLYWTDETQGGNVQRARFDGRQVTGVAKLVIEPAAREMFTGGDVNGDAVFTGEFSQANGRAVFACAIANPGTAFLDRWRVDISLCTAPYRN